ncbi:hypothetical protein MGMO_125c00100 [Methyloglobulus morosus KoM1]|uniref:Uncharacterized protein n=1 Tax=Methyloglobulus morosus KoM1 TaxID=1116472 RepID=V5DRV6_9GAMM|nr:hypothetical protein [Methyloglobulus morosus]ESS70136.1 hypothetical protein MGMO_125c00100 [Methyloglobulus morosus KoM1]
MTLSNKIFHLAAMILALNCLPQAIAGVNTPGIDQRQENQEERIEQGVSSGRLTQGETNRLEAQQDRIENAETRAKADGLVTPAERRHLRARENIASRNIYRKKHNFRHQ